MEEIKHLENAIMKIKAYSVLPEPQYVAMGREILSDLNNAIGVINLWREKYMEDQNLKHLESIIKMGENGLKTLYEWQGYSYTISVTKEKTKK